MIWTFELNGSLMELKKKSNGKIWITIKDRKSTMFDFPRFLPWVAITTISGGSYLRGRWVAYFSICPSCPAASALPVSSYLQVLGFAPGVVPGHPPDRPKLVVLGCFYTRDLFGQSDASQVKHCLLQDGGTQSRLTHAEVQVPKQAHLLCHCCWLLTVFSDAFSHSLSKHWPEHKFIVLF